MNKREYIVPDVFILSASEIDVLGASSTVWFSKDGDYGLDDKSIFYGEVL
jgi:hypothetical protein